ncbi:MAG TPA: CPBP family intramembrane glutamic endopeptidase [Flavobacteriales bacterium]|nr:CPBP family intramembrane glutamic endopeptidase [Flavobacteriales bacterium]
MSQEQKIPFLRNFSPAMNLMTVFSLVFLGTIVGTVVLWSMAKIFWNLNTFEEENLLSDLSNPSIVALVQTSFIISNICIFITPSTIFRRFMEYPRQDYLLIRKKPGLKTAGIIFLLFLVCFPASNFLYYVNNLLDFTFLSPDAGRQIRELENSSNEFSIRLMMQPGVPALIINLTATALFAAIGEELLFRGIFQRLFIKLFRNVHVAVIICAALFSFLHFSYYGFIPRFFMGLVLGYIYLATANIWYCMFFHFLNNAFAVTFGWLMGQGYDVRFFDMLGAGEGDKWVGFGLLVIIVAFGIIALKKIINRELVNEIREY